MAKTSKIEIIWHHDNNTWSGEFSLRIRPIDFIFFSIFHVFFVASVGFPFQSMFKICIHQIAESVRDIIPYRLHGTIAYARVSCSNKPFFVPSTGFCMRWIRNIFTCNIQFELICFGPLKNLLCFFVGAASFCQKIPHFNWYMSRHN